MLSKRQYITMIISFILLGMLGILIIKKYAKAKRHKKIVFLYSHTSSYHENIYQYFSKICTGKTQLEIEYLTTTTTTNHLLINSMCETITEQSLDCIIVVGKQLSQILGNTAVKKKCVTPIVFVGVDDPIRLGLVNSLEHPGGNVTGLFTVGLHNDVCARLITTTLPSIKKVLLPYYSNDDTEASTHKRAKFIQSFLQSHNIKTTIATLDSMPNALKTIESLLPAYDLIITLEGDAISNQLTSGIAKLSKQHGVPFFASSQAGISEGALCAYAIQPCYAAAAAYDLMHAILFDGMHPSAMPVVQLQSSREFIINTGRAAELGISLDIETILDTINTDPELALVKDRVRVI